MATTVLVTGASGFVGRHLCRRLAASGFNVHAITRRSDAFLERLGVRIWIGDLWESEFLRKTLVGVNVVIHCAGDPRFGNGSHYQRANADLTKHLIDAITDTAGQFARFVLVSSIGAVDRTRGDDCIRPLDESSTPAPSSDYGRSKLAAEDILRRSGLPFAIVRPAMVVGGDMRFASHFSVFARKSISPSLMGRLALPGRFSVVHVEDLAGALELVATHPHAIGKTFFCAGNEISLMAFFEKCAPNRKRIALTGITTILGGLLRWAPFPVKVMLLPALTASDKALRALGWSSRYTLDQSIEEVIARERARLDIDCDPGGQTIITGAASGLGRAIAEQLAPRRKSLLLIDRDREGLAAVASKFRNCRTVVMDLANTADVDLLVGSQAWHELPVTELFACAGFGARGSVQELPLERQRDIFHVNLISRLTLAHHAADEMSRNQFGRIVFISSSSAFQPLPFMAAYSASNAAVLALGEAWSHEISNQGTHIMTVCPGGMQTNFQNSAGVKTLEAEKLMRPEVVALRIIAGLARQRTTLIVSLRALAMSILARVLPRWVTLRLWARLMKSMR